MIHLGLRAILFDFNGVVAGDEGLPFQAFQRALSDEGLHLTQEEYYGRYLGMDEGSCLKAILIPSTDHPDPSRAERIHRRKAALFQEYSAHHPSPLFSGAIEFVTRAALRYRLPSRRAEDGSRFVVR